VGVDSTGRFLMIHSRSPISTHDFIDQLLDLPLDLYNAMYVEGGVEAQLAVETENTQLEFSGGFKSSLLENELSSGAWPIPNVIAVRARASLTDTVTQPREQE
jgi:phosphodiester glycosidase